MNDIVPTPYHIRIEAQFASVVLHEIWYSRFPECGERGVRTMVADDLADG
jgi:hypothetical protein